MTFEEMQKQWKAQERRVELLVRVNRELLRERMARPVRNSMQRLAWMAAFEAAFTFCGLLVTGSFLYSHWNGPRFFLPGLTLHAWLIAAFGASVYEIVQARSIDYGAAVPELQRRVARLGAFRVRSMQWALLTGQVVWWVPFLIVVCRGVLGVDLYRIVPAEHLALQVAVGIALIPVLVWTAKRIAQAGVLSGALAWVAHQVAGTELHAAEQALAELARFEADSGGYL